MIRAFYEIPAARHPTIYAPRPTVPWTSYREILEGDWNDFSDCSGKRETKEKHDNSALVIFETTFSSLYINSPHVVRQDLGQPENTADELSGHPVSEWEPPCKIPVRKERQRIHEESSSLSSLRLSSLSSPLSTSSFATVSTLPPLDIAKVDPVDRGEDLSNHAKVSVPTWSDDELQRDPVIKPTPTIPVHSDWEKPAVSRLTKWSTSVQNRYGV